MKIPVKIRDGVAQTPIYQPGLPIEHVAREYGLDAKSIVKLASNENPLGPSPKAMEAVRNTVADLHRYPDGGAWDLTHSLAAKFGLDPAQFIVGNGSNEILELLAQAFLEPGTNAVMGEYPFVVYPLVAQHFGAEVRKVGMPGLKHDLPAMLDAIDKNTRLVFIASPNNPTPYSVDRDELTPFIDALPDHVILCFDGAYAEYIEEPFDLSDVIKSGKSVIETRTFSKIYGLAGLRIGYGMAPEWIVNLLKRTRQPFSVNALALSGALAALEDEAFVSLSRNSNRDGTAQLCRGLDSLGIKWEAESANFILFHAGNAEAACEALLKRGVIVRSMAPFSLDGMIRVSVGSKAENDLFLNAISDF